MALPQLAADSRRCGNPASLLHKQSTFRNADWICGTLLSLFGFTASEQFLNTSQRSVLRSRCRALRLSSTWILSGRSGHESGPSFHVSVLALGTTFSRSDCVSRDVFTANSLYLQSAFLVRCLLSEIRW